MCSVSLQSTEPNVTSRTDKNTVGVTPGAQPENSPGAFWTREECFGYFEYMLEKWVPEGCHTNNGFHIGNITVGGETTLKDTVFEVTIVAG
jgi:hypothetical protein